MSVIEENTNNLSWVTGACETLHTTLVLRRSQRNHVAPLHLFNALYYKYIKTFRVNPFMQRSTPSTSICAAKGRDKTSLFEERVMRTRWDTIRNGKRERERERGFYGPWCSLTVFQWGGLFRRCEARTASTCDAVVHKVFVNSMELPDIMERSLAGNTIPERKQSSVLLRLSFRWSSVIQLQMSAPGEFVLLPWFQMRKESAECQLYDCGGGKNI